MDVFEFRERLVSDYSAFTCSFTRIHAEDLRSLVDEAYMEAMDTTWRKSH